MKNISALSEQDDFLTESPPKYNSNQKLDILQRHILYQDYIEMYVNMHY